ncbi:hypothetical protein LguiB_031458 [Lonicera macranthoides]
MEKNLPEDLLIDQILPRLPVKSLLRFKCVCKNWYNLIESPQFIGFHSDNPNNPTRLLVRHQTRDIPLAYDSDSSTDSDSGWDPENPCALAIFHDQTLKTHEDIIDFLQGVQCMHPIHIMGPVDGLFLLHTCMTYFPGTNDHLGLWNPATQDFRRLSKPNFRFPLGDTRSNILGFGFRLDPLTKEKDYKVVWIPTFEPGSPSDYAATALYTLGAESWKQIENPNVLDLVRDIWWRCSGSFHDCKECFDGVFLNGAFYWLVECNCGRQIGLFDMGTDEFRKIPAPHGIEAAFCELDLVLHIDSISLLQKEYTSPRRIVLESIHMWVMGEEGCWTKLFTLALGHECQFRRLLGFWKSHKEIFFETSANQLAFCNYKTRKGMYLGVHGHRSGNFLQVYKYKESLVSVEGEKMNSEELRDAIRDFFAVSYSEELSEEEGEGEGEGEEEMVKRASSD